MSARGESRSEIRAAERREGTERRCRERERFVLGEKHVSALVLRATIFLLSRVFSCLPIHDHGCFVIPATAPSIVAESSVRRPLRLHFFPSPTSYSDLPQAPCSLCLSPRS
eukprot:169553-Pleurochrysis_carterae.AAC.1